jgi:hypothetical protein
MVDFNSFFQGVGLAGSAVIEDAATKIAELEPDLTSVAPTSPVTVTGDLSDFVGKDVAPDVWFALSGRAEAMGWRFDTRAVVGGVHIMALHGRPVPAEEQAAWLPDYPALHVPESTLDASKEYAIHRDTGELITVSAKRLSVPTMHLDGD